MDFKGKIILLITIVAILIISAVFYYSNQNDMPPTEPENPEFPYFIDFSQANSISEDQLERLKQDYDVAVDSYNEKNDSYSALMTFAFINYQLKNFETARDIYVQVGENSPKNYNSFWNLANAYIQLKDYSGAEQAYLKTIENGPKQPRHYTALGELYLYNLQDKKNQIPDLYKKGLREIPNNYDLLIGLAQYYREIKDKENALHYYQEIIDNYPEMESAIKQEMEKIN